MLDEVVHVSLEIGARHRQVRVARVAAAGIATLAGLDVDAVENLRIAVDEGCVWLIERGDGSPLRLRFDVKEDGRVEVDGVTPRGPDADHEPTSLLVHQIMSAACAEHRFEHVGDQVRFWLLTAPPTADDAAAALDWEADG